MGQVRYYNPKDNAFKSLFNWDSTIFELVLTRHEFYLYIAWSLLMTSLVIYVVPPDEIDEFNWDAAAIMQYVMTFFVTFYNDRCYERYQALYPACCDFMDNVMYLVQEMNVTLPWRDLHYHRIACTKYLLAVVYEYFLIVCGGKLQSKSWEQFVIKGLLSPEECKMLEKFPGGESTFVLTSWVLYLIKDALVQDCMWRKKTGLKHWQPQQTVHIYNRHCNHVINMQRACHRIGYLLANPIPFAYYHIMNAVLMFNIIVEATFGSLDRSYVTCIRFSIALLVYMGLREISTSLADPFGKESIDFAVPEFLIDIFDNAVSQLYAFLRPDVREQILNQLLKVEDFHEHHLRRSTKQGVFDVDKDDPMRGTAVRVTWGSRSIFQKAREGTDLPRRLKYAFSAKQFKEGDDQIQVSRSTQLKKQFRQERKEKIKEAKEVFEQTKRYEEQTAKLQAEYNEIVEMLDKVIDYYPDILGPEMGVTIDVPEEYVRVEKETQVANVAASSQVEVNDMVV